VSIDDRARQAAAPVSSIAELYDEVELALSEAFPPSRELWVQGEIQKITQSGGHAYLDLVDPDSAGSRQAPTLKVKCWNRTWTAVQRDLAGQGLSLEAGMTVVLRGTLDFYRPRAELGFILAEVDVTALLGRMALERAALIEALKFEGLFDAQRQLEVPPVPLRIGLVGSPRTEGFNDFLGQLERSGLSFGVTVARATVQGLHAPREVASAIEQAAASEVDLICVVRGGGSKGDLVAFDAPEIARAIASCPVPVWTGIGHTGDESVADLVANWHAITPTACAGEVVERVAEYWAGVRADAGRIAQRAVSICQRREQAYSVLRGQLVASARGLLRSHSVNVAHTRRRLASAPNSMLRSATERLHASRARLVPASRGRLGAAGASLAARQRLLSAYDPMRTLRRGWSLTLDAQGRAIRSVAQLEPGELVTTRVADGSFSASVTSIEAAEEER
jgi:exodeoxyribonuclease VII large subunit